MLRVTGGFGIILGIIEGHHIDCLLDNEMVPMLCKDKTSMMVGKKVEIDGVGFIIRNDNKATLEYYPKTSKELIIPRQIRANGQYITVDKIGCYIKADWVFINIDPNYFMKLIFQ